MRSRITRDMLENAASFISERILGHEHSRAMGGYHIGTYENLVYSEPGSTAERTILRGETRRDMHNQISAMLEGFYQKRKHDKAVFVPIIAELWCASEEAEKTTSMKRYKDFRAAGEASGRLAATLLTLRRIYGESEVDAWYRAAMAYRQNAK